MTPTETSGRRRLAKKRQYRRLMWGSLLGGVGIGLVLRFLDYSLVGEAVYWIGVLGFLAVWQGTSLSLFDERDRELEARASKATVTVFAVVLALGASAARVLSWTDTYTAPPVVWGALYGYIALLIVFGVIYGLLRR